MNPFWKESMWLQALSDVGPSPDNDHIHTLRHSWVMDKIRARVVGLSSYTGAIKQLQKKQTNNNILDGLFHSCMPLVNY